MILSIGDWVFDVNVEDTMAYSRGITEDHCECGYCRNFYASVDEKYPNLRLFLTQFGADVEGPDEMMPFEPTVCQITYCISGKVLSAGREPICIDGTVFDVVNGEDLDIDTDCPKPCFALITGYLELPWVLEENMEEVISPANEPECLQRMWGKLLSGANETVIS